MNHTKEFNRLLQSCPINGHLLPAKWACWMRTHGREKRMHGALLDSSILDWIEQFFADPSTRVSVNSPD